MEKLILGVILYFGWMFIKNAFNQNNTAKRPTQRVDVPPVVHQSGIPFFDFENKEDEYDEEEYGALKKFEKVEYPQDNSQENASFVQAEPLENMHAYSKEKKTIQSETNSKEDANLAATDQVDGFSDLLDFSQQSLLSGIIMSEVLGKPKAARNR